MTSNPLQFDDNLVATACSPAFVASQFLNDGTYSCCVEHPDQLRCPITPRIVLLVPPEQGDSGFSLVLAVVLAVVGIVLIVVVLVLLNKKRHEFDPSKQQSVSIIVNNGFASETAGGYAAELTLYDDTPAPVTAESAHLETNVGSGAGYYTGMPDPSRATTLDSDGYVAPSTPDPNIVSALSMSAAVTQIDEKTATTLDSDGYVATSTTDLVIPSSPSTSDAEKGDVEPNIEEMYGWGDVNSNVNEAPVPSTEGFGFNETDGSNTDPN